MFYFYQHSKKSSQTAPRTYPENRIFEAVARLWRDYRGCREQGIFLRIYRKNRAVRWPVSRVLFHSRMVMVIHLARLLPAASSDLPGHRRRIAPTAFKRHVSLHGLAPDGVYHAQPVASLAVRSYRTFSPLPRRRRCAARRFVFCGTFPRVAPAGRYPAS